MVRNPIPITPDRHAGRRWLPNRSYAFAAGQALIPLTAAELPRAALAMPVGFVASGDGFIPAALVGLEPGRNLFVLPDGRWAGEYVPALLRAYPFVLGRPAGGGEPVLCIDEGSGLLSDEAGEPFFDDARRPAPALARVIGMMAELERNRAATAVACAALARHAVIAPWSLTVRLGAEEHAVAGLYRIDETALRRLPDPAFLDLRGTAGLDIAYAQLLSLGRMPLLGQLAGLAHRQPPAAEPDFEQLRGMTFEF